MKKWLNKFWLARNYEKRLAECESALSKQVLEFVGDEDVIGELDYLLGHLRIYINRLRGFCVELKANYGDFAGSSLRCCIEVAIELINRKKPMAEAELLGAEWSEFQVHLNQIKSKDSADRLSDSLRNANEI